MSQVDELPVCPGENGEVLNVVVASVLTFDGVKHDCFSDAVAIKIASDDFARIGILLGVFMLGLGGNKSVDGGFVSVLR